MKKFQIALLMIAAMISAVVLSGCSSSDFVEEIELEEVAIEFSSSTNNATRSAINSESNLATAGGFDVFAYKAKIDGSSVNWSNGWYNVFNGTNVTGKRNDNTWSWSYSNTRYWDKTCGYAFYAVAPHNTNTSLVYLDDDGAEKSVEDNTNKANLSIKIANVKSGRSTDANTKDYLITRGAVQRNGSNNTEKVNFEFHHVMSKVSVNLKAADGMTGCAITVKEVKMTGWSTQSCTFIQNSTTVPNNDLSEWHLPETVSSHNKSGNATFKFGGDDGVTFGKGQTTETASSADYWIMVPQAIPSGQLKFTVSYTITYRDGVVESFTDVECVIPTAQNWWTDCHTTYTLTISPDPIKFDVTSVSGYGSQSSTVVVQ